MNREVALMQAGWESIKSVKDLKDYWVKDGQKLTLDEAFDKEFGNEAEKKT